MHTPARTRHRRLPTRPDTATGADDGVVERPDGWYWVAPDGHPSFGPFDSARLARDDRDRASEQSVNEAEAEREAEQDLGVAPAIDEERGDALGDDAR